MGNKGISYVEILAGLIILAIVVMVSFATYVYFSERLGRVTCEANMTAISKAIEEYYVFKSGSIAKVDETIDLSALRKEGFLLVMPECPKGGVYRLDPAGWVYCTYHGYHR